MEVLNRRNLDFKKSKKGQALVEIVLAIGIASLVLIGLTRVVTLALKNNQFAKDKVLATQYAQAGLEEARKLRDQNPDVFWSKSGTETGKLGKFTRAITYTPLEANKKMKIVVIVSWGDNQVKLTSFLTKWQ